MEQEQQSRQAFDVWFLNILPRPSRFLYNEGGYLTLSSFRSLGTMLIAWLQGAGLWTRSENSAAQVLIQPRLSALPASCSTSPAFCPIVKRIWTPSWTLFSGGVCFFYLAVFSWIVVSKNKRALAFPAHRHRHEFHCRYVIAELAAIC